MTFVRRNWEVFVFLIVGLLLLESLAVVKAAPLAGYRYDLVGELLSLFDAYFSGCHACFIPYFHCAGLRLLCDASPVSIEKILDRWLCALLSDSCLFTFYLVEYFALRPNN